MLRRYRATPRLTLLNSTLAITRLQPDDLPGVWAIEQTLVGPWTLAQLQEELALAHGWHLVAKDGAGIVVAYLFGSRVLDEAEIRKIAVAADHRRQGIADLLLRGAWQHLAQFAVSSCFLELRATNLAALSLYQKNGFQIIGRRRNYYTLPTEDAMVLVKSFIPQ